MKEIAVIIPAYKKNFLEKCIRSFMVQSNKNFHLYIFNDNSPQDLDSIVSPLLKHEAVTYHKFDTNLGGSSLVKHWERCISMTEEPWIWLFSDDDYVDRNCIASLLSAREKYPEQEIFRFNKNTINESEKPLRSEILPEFETELEFFKSAVLKSYSCTLPEHSFSRAVYDRNGGFEHFDLAWGSDLASMLNFAHNHGIRTLADGVVYYRMSAENISSTNNEVMILRKMTARMQLFQWFESKQHLEFIYNGKNSSYYLEDNLLYYIAEHVRTLPIVKLWPLAKEMASSMSGSFIKLYFFLLRKMFRF